MFSDQGKIPPKLVPRSQSPDEKYRLGSSPTGGTRLQCC